jgi:uncharacterized membrane protein
MNRKKALILIMALQFMLLAMLIVLFISHVMSVSAFASAIIIVGVVCTIATLLAVRKLPPM